jgi:hypothetical protein
MSFAPFRDGDTSSTFQNHIAKLTQEIRGLENSYVLRTSPTGNDTGRVTQGGYPPRGRVRR